MAIYNHADYSDNLSSTQRIIFHQEISGKAVDFKALPPLMGNCHCGFQQKKTFFGFNGVYSPAQFLAKDRMGIKRWIKSPKRKPKVTFAMGCTMATALTATLL